MGPLPLCLNLNPLKMKNWLIRSGSHCTGREFGESSIKQEDNCDAGKEKGRYRLSILRDEKRKLSTQPKKKIYAQYTLTRASLFTTFVPSICGDICCR